MFGQNFAILLQLSNNFVVQRGVITPSANRPRKIDFHRRRIVTHTVSLRSLKICKLRENLTSQVTLPANFSYRKLIAEMSYLNYRSSYRRNLPHVQPPGAILFITFRLAGSL